MLMLYPLSTRNRISALTSSGTSGGTSGGATGVTASTTGRGASVAASSPQATPASTADSETNAAAKGPQTSYRIETRQRSLVAEHVSSQVDAGPVFQRPTGRPHVITDRRKRGSIDQRGGLT